MKRACTDTARPTPSERAERQQIATAILESAKNNVRMPLPGLTAITVHSAGLFFNAVDVENFVLALAQEIALLLEERTSAALTIDD